MTVVTDTIDADLATLTRVTPTPVEPFGYGTDLSCTDQLADPPVDVDSFSLRALWEALFRRLTTPNGTLLDDPDYGLDLRSFVSRGVTVTELASLQDKIRMELLKDDRVSSVEAVVTIVSLQAITARVAVVPVDPNMGEFDMTLAVTSAEVVLEAIS